MMVDYDLKEKIQKVKASSQACVAAQANLVRWLDRVQQSARREGRISEEALQGTIAAEARLAEAEAKNQIDYENLYNTWFS